MDDIQSEEVGVEPDPNQHEVSLIELEGESESSWHKYRHILFDRIAQKWQTFLNSKIRNKTVSESAGNTLESLYDLVDAQIETKKLASAAKKTEILKTLAETRKLNAEAQQIETDTMARKAKMAQSAQLVISELLEKEYIAITEENGEISIVILKDTPSNMMTRLSEALSVTDKSLGAVIEFKSSDGS